LIDGIEYLVNNSISSFIITMGIMYMSLQSLYGIIVRVTSVLVGLVMGVMSEAVAVAMRTVGVFTMLGVAWGFLTTSIQLFYAGLVVTVGRFVALSQVVTRTTFLLTVLGEVWAFLSALFLRTPLGIIILALAALGVAIYKSVTSSEAHSKALQETTITYANNALKASQLADKLRELSASKEEATAKSDSYNAVLKQIAAIFPDLTKEMMLAKQGTDDQNVVMERQAVVLDKVAARYRAMGEAAASASVRDLADQWKKAGLEAQYFSEALLENRNQFSRWLDFFPNVRRVVESFVPMMLGSTVALETFTKAWVGIQLAWNATSAKAGVEAAEKMNAALNKQRDIYPQLASIIINSSQKSREALLKLFPESEVKELAKATIKAYDEMVNALKDGQTELVKKQVDTVAKMGQQWVDYYKQQDTDGKAEVVSFAIRADKKIESEMKAFEKLETNATLRLEKRKQLEEKYFQEMMDLRAKDVENTLKLLDKLYEEQHKRRKVGLEATLQFYDIEQKAAMTALGNRGLKEAEYLKQKEGIERLYFARNKAAIEANTETELRSLANLYAAKNLALEQDRTLSEEAKKNRKIQIETENTEKLVAIYKEQLTALKTHIGEKVTEFNGYKTKYDATLKEIEKLEADHLKVMLDANKKYLQDLAKINLEGSKWLEDIEKLKRDARQSTMTPDELARDKVNEYNETLAKGYSALKDSEVAADSITAKEKVKIAQDYFKEASGMIKGLVKENIDAEGKVTQDKEATKRAQLGYYGEMETAAKSYIAAMKIAAALEKEETIKASKDKTDALKKDLQDISNVAKDNMTLVAKEIGNMVTKYKEVLELTKKAVEIKADTTHTYIELEKLVKHITKLKEDKSLEVILTFAGAMSPPAPLVEVIEKVKTLISGFQSWITTNFIEKSATFVMEFKGNDNGWFWLSSLIDSIKGKLEALYIAANKTASFVTEFKGNDNGWFWLGSLIDFLKTKIDAFFAACNRTATFVVQFNGFSVVDSLISQMNALYAASNRTATFTIKTATTGGGGSSSGGSGNVAQYDGSSSYGGSDNYDGSSNTFVGAEGGSVPGSGDGDSVPAMLTPGEFVVRKSAVQTFGEGFFHMVNRMKSFTVPKMNMGGIVQSFRDGGPVRSHEIFTLNLQAGAATLPLKVVGNPNTMRQNVRRFEKELDRMRLSRG
jgi:hypothetical protein